MKPVNKKSKCTPVSYECLEWQGDNIPCLDIYKGDMLNTITYALTEEICNIEGLGDLSSLTVEKLYSVCHGKKIEKELVPILQLMIDNNICFKDTLNNILIKVGLLESGTPFLLNTSCLGKGIDDIEKTLQAIISNICTFRSDIENINTQLDAIQLSIDEVEDVGTPENIIDTCLLEDGAISEQTIEAALQACALNTDIGEWSTPEVMGDLAVYYASGTPLVDGCAQIYPNGWILKVDCEYTLADIINNLAIAFFGQEERIHEIETECCTSKCEDIELGFSILPNEEQTAVILRFRDVDGTKIPSDFSDCGSKVVVTDVNGDIETFTIELANELVTEDLDLSNLDLTEPVNIQVQARLCSETYTCTQCLGVEYDMQVDGCPVCLITSEGEGDITIIYDDGN